MYTQLIIVVGCNLKIKKIINNLHNDHCIFFKKVGSFHEKHLLDSAPNYILITKIAQRCVQHGQNDQQNKDWFVELYFDMEIIND
jgi:hypothetical protein